jgi:CheY-like chemotaxis protein
MLQRTVPKGVVFASSFEEPCPIVEGDPSLLSQALVNLCLNAVDAMRGVGTLTIAVGSRDVVPDVRAAISVTDTGCGIDAETQRRIFEPFFTTKGVGRGTGLGLAMVYGTVKAWGGSIEVESCVGAGTTMTVCLPSIAAPPTTGKRPLLPPSISSAKGTILVVDDDPRIRRVARRILEIGGYQVHEACDGADALSVFDKQRDHTQLVVLDMAMPVMGGAECFRALRARDPELRILLASGYALEEDARRCLSEGAIGFVDKPYTVDKFAAAVAMAMRGELVHAVE